MPINVGTVDRAARNCAGIALILLAVAHVIGPWGYIGLLPLVTGLLRACPAYSLLGWNTCTLKKP